MEKQRATFWPVLEGELSPSEIEGRKIIAEQRRKLAGKALAAELAHLREPRRPRVLLDPERRPALRRDGMMEVHLSDGKKLEIGTTSFGPQDGYPILWLPGTPASAKVGPMPRAIDLHIAGIRVVALDRPGYGDSTRHKGRTIADSATYIEAAAEAYNLQEYSIAARSGGALSALAAAALLAKSERIIKNVAIIAGPAPANADIDRFEGMSVGNIKAYGGAIIDEDGLWDGMQKVAEASKPNVYALLETIIPDMSDADKEYVERHPRVIHTVAEGHAEGMKRDAAGRYDDAVAYMNDPGFDVADIEVPVLVIQGEADSFTPPSHFDWYADHLTNKHTVYLPNVGHMGTLDYTFPVFMTLTRHALGQLDYEMWEVTSRE